MTSRVTHVLYLSEREGMNPFSGAENHLCVLLPALARQGVEVNLLAMLMGEGDFPIVRRRLAELRVQGVQVVEVVCRRPVVGGRKLQLLFAWARLWGLLRRRCDQIVHLHLEMHYTPFVAWLAGCRQIVFSLHNDRPEFREMAGGLRFWLLRRAVPEFIAISQRVRTHFLEHSGVPAARVHTIYYGYHETPPTRLTRRDLGLSPDRFVVGFVGRLTEQKNLPALVAAVAARPGIQLVLVGAGPLRASLERQAAESGAGNVLFLGPRADAASLMPLFDVLCLPSLWEGLGLVLIEAMLAGVPVIGSDRGAIPDILGDGSYGIVCPPSVEGIGAAVDRASSEAVGLHDRSNRAKAYAMERFSVARMCAETVEIYTRFATPR